jgi:hypothetical protein
MRIAFLFLCGFIVLAEDVTAQVATSLYYPRIASSKGTGGPVDNSDLTGMAIANLDTVNATLTFTAYDQAGTVISGTGITNPTTRQLNAGAQFGILDTEVFGAGFADTTRVAWVKVDSTAAKVVGFFIAFNSTVGSLDGADVSAAKLTSFVLPEIEDQAATQIRIANPNSTSTNVTLSLIRSDGSTRAGPLNRLIPSNGVLADVFTNVFPGAPADASDYIRVTADAGVVPFEDLGAVGQYMYALNGQATDQGGTTLYAPQYVAGPGWRTTLSVVNLDSTSGTVTLRLFKNDGTAIGSAQQKPISPRGKILITDQAFFTNSGTTLTEGYVQITSSGPKLSGSVVFGDPGRSIFASSLPLLGTKRSVVFSHVASSAFWFTGVAMLNPGTVAANAVVQVYDQSGNLLISKAENIPAGYRKSRLLTDYFPALDGQDRIAGYIRVIADRDLATFAVFGTQDVSVLSAIPPQTSPTAATDAVTLPAYGTLTINGSGFDPTNAAISVLVKPKGTGLPAVIPVFSATPTSLDVVIPPLVDSATGNFTSGSVDLQVIQVTSSTVNASAVVAGPSIADPYTVPASVKTGSISRAYMTSALEVLRTTAASPRAAKLITSINKEIANLNTIIAAVDVAMNGGTASLDTRNGQPFTLDKPALALMDRMVMAQLLQFSPYARRTSERIPKSSLLSMSDTACLANTGNPFTDGFICEKQTYSQNLAETGAKAVQMGAKFEMGFYFGALGGAIGTAAAEAGAAASTAKVASMLFGVASDFITSYATASPAPQLKDTLEGIGADSADSLLEIYAKWGVPFIKPAYDAFNLVNQAMELTAPGSTAPKGGLATSSSSSNVTAGNQSVLAVARSSAGLAENRIQVPPAATTTSVSAAQRPQAGVSQFDGSYSGSYTGTWNGKDGTYSVGGSISFSVRNGGISISSPATGSGSLSATGLVLFGGGAGGGLTCTFGGTFTLASISNRVLAGGSWRCDAGADGSSSGTWSGAR